MSDYEPDKSIYYVEQYAISSVERPFNWITNIRNYYWPSSNGGILYRRDKQTEPFGPFVTEFDHSVRRDKGDK